MRPIDQHDLIYHVDEFLGGREVHVERLSFRDVILLLTRIHGSSRAAARAVGVAESTFRGWRHGAVPRGNQRVEEMRTRARRYAVNQDRWTAARRGDADSLLTIKGIIRVSEDVRERTVYPGRYIPIRVIRYALDQWLQGQDHAADRTLEKAIDTYYQPLAFDQIMWAGFGNPPR